MQNCDCAVLGAKWFWCAQLKQCAGFGLLTPLAALAMNARQSPYDPKHAPLASLHAAHPNPNYPSRTVGNRSEIRCAKRSHLHQAIVQLPSSYLDRLHGPAHPWAKSFPYGTLRSGFDRLRAKEKPEHLVGKHCTT